MEAEKNSEPLVAKRRKIQFRKTTCQGQALPADAADKSDPGASPSSSAQYKTRLRSSSILSLPSPAMTPDTLMINNVIDNIEDIPIESLYPFNNRLSDDDDETVRPTGRPKQNGTSLKTETKKRKLYKYSNLEYKTSENKIVKPKVFINYQCKCLNKCASLIPEEKRKEEFEKFVRLGSYNAQLLYIGSCVKEENKKRSYTMTHVPAEKKKPKQFNRVYKINGVKVCRDMFLKTFQITTQRVTVTLKKLRSGGPIKDCRGYKSKLPDEDYKFIVDIIVKLPKYESLVKRDDNGALNLQPGMTLDKMYDLYRREHTQKYGDKRKCASFTKMLKIFFSFNLKCNSQKATRDIYYMFDDEGSEEEEEAKAERKRRFDRVNYFRSEFFDNYSLATKSPSVECLKFYFEKVLPLPCIPTTDAFYKKRLWFYVFNIHSPCYDIGVDFGHDQRYVWVEGEAGRGAQEVGSCLIKYINQKLSLLPSSSVEHLILWSECCSGQNQNIKIVLMLKAILSSHQSLRTISIRFLHSEDTRLKVNDIALYQIENALYKRHQRVYTAEEYVDIINKKIGRKYNEVYKMQKTDFYSAKILEQNTINRKKFTDKSNVNWSLIKDIKIEKDKPFSIFMRKTFEEDFKKLNIKKQVRGRTRHIKDSDLCCLWPEGRPIAPAKMADLQSMYKYIPDDCLHFYKTLKSSDDIVDDVDGFGKLDFDIATYEDDDS